MKRTIFVLLVLCIVATLCGCRGILSPYIDLRAVFSSFGRASSEDSGTPPSTEPTVPPPCQEHVFTKPITLRSPTCTEDGLQSLTCIKCGAKREEKVPAAHTLAEEVIQDGGCTGKWIMNQYCTRCNYKEPLEFTAEGHDYNSSGICIYCSNSKKEIPFTVKLSSLTGIYKGPGNDFDYRKSVGQTAEYTIVEVRYDDFGNRWGMLKSGSGWVNLTKAEKDSTTTSKNPIISAEYATSFSGYLTFTKDSDYLEYIEFRAGDDWEDISLYQMDLGMELNVLFTASYLPAGETFVAALDFPGVGTGYSIYFKDSNGRSYRYEIYQSGNSGEISLTKG